MASQFQPLIPSAPVQYGPHAVRGWREEAYGEQGILSCSYWVRCITCAPFYEDCECNPDTLFPSAIKTALYAVPCIILTAQVLVGMHCSKSAEVAGLVIGDVAQLVYLTGLCFIWQRGKNFIEKNGQFVEAPMCISTIASIISIALTGIWLGT